MDHTNDSSMVFRFENETGTRQIQAYEVFPGILLSYNNFHLEKCESNYAQSQNMFGFELYRGKNPMGYPGRAIRFSGCRQFYVL